MNQIVEITSINELNAEMNGKKVHIKCHIRRSRAKGKFCYLELDDGLFSVQAILSKSNTISGEILKQVATIPFRSNVDVIGIVSYIDVAPIHCSQKDIELILEKVISI
jgi:aspartyl/asparaginyl-tRNA synthetase